MAEGGKQSIPKNLAAAIRWMESRVGIAEEDKVSNEALFKRCFERAAVEAEQGASVKKAPRLPIAVLVALELGVLDGAVPPVLRVVMWTRLLKTYGCLRADDLQRMAPEGVHLTSSGISGKLARTKTTRGGKKVRVLAVFIPSETWLVAPLWLRVGFDLWTSLAPWERDHFLPRSLPNLCAFEKRHAGTSDVAALNVAALAYLGKPVWLEGEWGTDSGKWLPRSVVEAWTGHSERATLTSALATLGIGREERNPLGRWAPEASDGYVRTYRALVRKFLARFVQEVHSGRAYQSFDEDETYLAILEAIKEDRRTPQSAETVDRGQGHLEKNPGEGAEQRGRRDREREEHGGGVGENFGGGRGRR